MVAVAERAKKIKRQLELEARSKEGGDGPPRRSVKSREAWGRIKKTLLVPLSPPPSPLPSPPDTPTAAALAAALPSPENRRKKKKAVARHDSAAAPPRCCAAALEPVR